MSRPLYLGRIVRSACMGALAVTSVAMIAGGCLDRPVAPSDPNVSARVVENAKQNKVSKIDLLFMIDNSSSMADKQTILAAAVPDLVNRLVNPVCVDPNNNYVQVGMRDATGKCATGEPDFQAVADIHIGIISSSLGGHGAAGVCSDDVDTQRGRTDPHNDDKGHLITRGATNVPLGFLNWNPTGGGATTVDQINTPFVSMVAGIGQHGCGYEAQLESTYRFLIEPDPYDTITITNGLASLVGTDKVLLAQRASFLRPDSLVSVIAVTDENDCSIQDGGQNYYALLPPITPVGGGPAQSVLRHGTSACLTNPNDKCCFNCQQTAPAGCADPAGDPECAKGPWLKTEDPENLRCWNQKQRYGVDFLYPPQRYIDGFTSSQIYDRSGKAVKNPLFDDLSTDCVKSKACASERDKSLVFYAGIVGVPWQDISRNGDIKQGFMTSDELLQNDVWSKIIGDPTRASGPVAPTDVHMIESVLPRKGLAGPTSAPNADPINGHEWDPSKLTRSASSDLQYACVFPLPGDPKVCAMGGQDCDCAPEDVAAGIDNPLCTGTNMQNRAKGYPGIRELQVLQGLASQAIVASICPSNVTDTAGSDYGYRPAIAALISRLRNALRGRCLPRQLQPDADGKVPCVIIEAFNPPKGSTACDCTNATYKGRSPIPAGSSLLTDDVTSQGSCFCEINQLANAADRTACETQLNPTVPDGWCYVDPTYNGKPACDIVKSCAVTEKRIIRFANATSEPRAGATAVIMCQESSFPSSGGGAPVNVCPAQ